MYKWNEKSYLEPKICLEQSYVVRKIWQNIKLFDAYSNFQCNGYGETHSRMYSAMYTRWVSVVEFHDWALGIGKVFGQELTVVKWNYQILGLHQVTIHQKLGVILVIKWFKNWGQQKMLFTKKVCFNWYSSMIFF